MGTLVVKPVEPQELTIRVQLENSTRVKVLDLNGNPVEGALVGYRSLTGGTTGHAKTGADGVASVDPTIQSLLPRRLIARFEQRGEVQFAELDGKDDVADEIRVMKLRPSITVSGVVSVQSQPIGNAKILVRRPNGANAAYTVATGVTDEQGAYSIQVPRGSLSGSVPNYRVQVASKKIPNDKILFAVNKTKLIDGQLQANIELVQGAGKVAGIVVNAKGDPIANSLVEVQRLMMLTPERKEMQPSHLFEATSQYTDREGRFEISGLPAGYEVVVVAGMGSVQQGGAVISVGNQAAKLLVTDVGEESKVSFPLR